MKRFLFSLMAIVLCLGIMGSAFAYFSDTATSETNSFTSGTLSINNEAINSDPVNFTLPNMAPGDVTDWFVVDIVNDGSINLGWLGDWQFGGNATLMNALYVAEAKMEFLTPTLNNWLTDATIGYESPMVDHFITNGQPSGPYGPYLGPVGSFGVYTFNAFNNWAGMVPGSVYEHAGALKPGYKYKLSVKFGLAAGAGNEYQNLGPVTVNLQVNATQINSAALQLQGVPPASAPGIVTWMNAQIADQTEQ